ncbi:hypothetical protein IW249_004343 [Micromonospora vinacea]|uniref:DUF6896 domain-containing protein n=1 Tax=Micromonospora vinacea TaxID=709878 RepID=A0ABS0K7F9_9ACTN|nr:hypothetical protein [Micromonospora vinacea]MBG6103929.1 hypothetical protein [Micromonospora vinacea]
MGEESELAIAAVRRYAVALRHIQSRLFDAYPDVSGIKDLMTAVRHKRTLPRAGMSSTGVEYAIHGAGCQMTDEVGRVVDVDLVGDVEAFDAWRIRWFLDEQSDAGPSVEELRTACSHLASTGELLEVQAGSWYALPDRRGKGH